MILLNLFLAFSKIALFSIGGAYSFLPLIEKEIVERYHWLTKVEFSDILGIGTILPGAISVKYATYIGYKVAGVPGVIFANLGNVLPSVLLFIIASLVYTKYSGSQTIKHFSDTVRVCIFGMIIALAFRLIDIRNLMAVKNSFVIILSFLIFAYTNTHPAIVIILAGLIGIVWR